MHFTSKPSEKDPAKTEHNIEDAEVAKVFEFLKKNKLVSDPDKQTSNQHFQILSNKVIDYFYSLIKIYYGEIVLNLPGDVKKYFQNNFPFINE